MNGNTTERDQEIFARQLDDFVPDRIFDAHAHLWNVSHQRSTPHALCVEEAEIGWKEYEQKIAQITPGRKTSALFFPIPVPDADIEASNRFIMEEARKDAQSRAQMLVTPELDPEYIRETVRRDGYVGLKCYHVFSVSKPSFDAPIFDYLPEEQVRVAHQEGLSITLHMVRPRAMADPVNQEVLRAWGEKYPNARFILAHAARGFNPHHTMEGIGALRGMRNFWCDTSAVTDCGALEAIIQTLGVDRLLYGSDFSVSHLRGRCVGLGDSFLWLSPENVDLGAAYANVEMTMVGIEALRALKVACRSLKLSDSQVQAIFYDNAVTLFNLTS